MYQRCSFRVCGGRLLEQELDLNDPSRALVHMGPLARRQRSEADWYGWSDLTVALLDHYRN